MVRRTTPTRRVIAGTGEPGSRRVIMTSSGPRDELALDDRPLAIARSHDGRHLIVTLPYELWILDAKTLAAQRSIPLTMARPSVVEGWEGALWIAGQHLFRANLQTTSSTKIGSKLGGYVDHITLIRDDLLCGVGSQGELLWDIDRAAPTHRRKSVSGTAAIGVVATADARAVFCDGSETAWVLDPAHLAGYAQLRLPNTSPVSVRSEGIVCLGRTDGTHGGRVLLGARDGAVAWTTRDLRMSGERIPAGAGKRDLTPLALAGDERWVYALRGRGVLQRFLVAQPHPPKSKPKPKSGGMLGSYAKSEPEPEPTPLPEAQEVRLAKLADCMTLVIGDDKRTLILGGPKADGQLGRLWTVEVESLEWQELELGARTLAEAPPPPDPDAEPPAPVKPSFILTKNKISGIKLREISVDDIVGHKVEYWLTTNVNAVLDRPVQQLPLADVLAGDAILLPAMVRFAEGTARPGLLVWPGVVEDHVGPAPAPQWLVWGDEPRGWMPLETPDIRQQKWSRTDVFPLRVALAGLPSPRSDSASASGRGVTPAPETALPENVPGKRVAIDPKWVDREHFEALAKECKKLLKVLW